MDFVQVGHVRERPAREDLRPDPHRPQAPAAGRSAVAARREHHRTLPENLGGPGMTRLRVLLFRLRALVRSRQMDLEIDDEITSHLAEATEDYVRQRSEERRVGKECRTGRSPDHKKKQQKAELE